MRIWHTMILKILKKIRTMFVFRGFGMVGNNSYLGKPLYLVNPKYIFVGDGVRIKKGIRLEVIRNWFGSKCNGSISIGNNTNIEQNCHFISAGKLAIGPNCLISSNVFITDCSHEYADINTPVIKQPLIVKETIIDEGVYIGFGTCVLAGVHIGKHCVIGANSVLTKSVPDYSVVAGCPAKILKKYNVETMKWETLREH